MTNSNTDAGKAGGWADKFRKEATPETEAMFAEHLLGIALQNAVSTPELKLLRQAPFLIVGCLNARDIPLTNNTLGKSLDLFADTIIVPVNLEQDMLGEKFDAQYADKDAATSSSTEAEIGDDTSDEDNIMFQRMLERVRASGAISDKIHDAMVPTLRHELGLDPKTSEYDTLQALSKSVTRGFSQLLEAVQPGSTTNPEHDLWKADLVKGIVEAYRAKLRETVIHQAKGMGMLKASKPADPSPMG